jgi:SAM-dependent methyltransferase
MNPVSLLRECGRILRPDGKVVIITPNTESLGHKWFGPSWRGLEPPRHLHIFNSIALRRVAEEVGLSVCSLTSILRGAVGIFRASYSIQDHITGGDSRTVRCYWSRALQWVEWFLIQVGQDRGEELVMICEKN